MQEVILVIHLVLAIALVGAVLLQRSEGGALGIGGGGGGGGGGLGGFMTARGAANFLTRLTAILAAGFVCTSITLGVMSTGQSTRGSLMEDEAEFQIPIEEQNLPPLPADPADPAVPFSD